MYCLHCRRTFEHPHRNKYSTTSTFLTHERNCSELKKQKTSSQSKSRISSFFDSAIHSSTTIASASSSIFTKEKIEEQIIKYFTAANVPFNQASNPHFKKLVGMIHLDYKPFKCPSRTTLRRRLTALSEMSEKDLKNTLQENKSKISLALDCWSSRANDGYLGMSDVMN